MGEGSCLIEPIQKSTIKYKKFDILDVNNKDQKVGMLFVDISFKDRSYLEKDGTEKSHSTVNLKVNPMQKKKNTDFFLQSRQNSQDFFNPIPKSPPLTVNK